MARLQVGHVCTVAAALAAIIPGAANILAQVQRPLAESSCLAP